MMIIALMMVAESASETSVNFKTTRLCNPEDSHTHTHGRENLKSYSCVHLFMFPLFNVV
jgi:hypothetical protein